MKLIFFVLLALNVVVLTLFQFGGTRNGEAMKGHESFQAEKVKLISEAELQAMKAPEPNIPAVQSAVAAALPDEKPKPTGDVVVAAGKARKPEKPAPPPTAAAPLRCAEWSGIAAGDMARAKQVLQQLKLWEKASARKLEKATGYWVFVPPRKSAADAQKKVDELKRLGVADTYVLQENTPFKYAISLGVFSTEDAAAKYLAQLKEKGVRSAESGARRRETDASVFTFKNLEAKMLADVTKLQQEFPGSETRTTDCR
ncbi:MAG: SPOR domain-containing protein [Sulfuricellaceae bacterium]